VIRRPSAQGSTVASNYRFVPVKLADATDLDGDSVASTVSGVAQHEPLNGARDNNTAPDARASAPGGRVYRVAFTVSDGRGVTCTARRPQRARAVMTRRRECSGGLVGS
jgi:hypothetical protein